MSDRPFARLPPSITLTIAETWVLLQAVDVAAAHAPPGSEDAVRADAARRLLTAKLWPELGDLLDEEGED